MTIESIAADAAHVSPAARYTFSLDAMRYSEVPNSNESESPATKIVAGCARDTVSTS